MQALRLTRKPMLKYKKEHGFCFYTTRRKTHLKQTHLQEAPALHGAHRSAPRPQNQSDAPYCSTPGNFHKFRPLHMQYSQYPVYFKSGCCPQDIQHRDYRNILPLWLLPPQYLCDYKNYEPNCAAYFQRLFHFQCF